MAHLIRIGNSQGIRIPKLIIEQANLEGKELKLQVVNERLVVEPVKKARDGWKQSIEEIMAINGNEVVDNEWLDAKLTSDDDLEW
ncbi:AbrB/MazE/SpoVT family DNA-binding domain-containing protein [Thiotrichales bacterium HSG1]|nr:AbrB/MazE/SpoVT family DNA-binding domain-containing protein [Thiotrichales bacterium HSG1]